jgi:hypothetical protein
MFRIFCIGGGHVIDFSKENEMTGGKLRAAHLLLVSL